MKDQSLDRHTEMDTTDFNDQFQRSSAKLKEYEQAAKTMDEYTFRQTFEKDQGFLPFSIIHLSNISLSLYRSRLERTIGKNENLSSPQTFSYVPLKLTNKHFPKLQRANFSGQSIFYGSLSPTTNFREISEDVSAGENVFMAKWNFSPEADLMLNGWFPKRGAFLNDNFKKVFGLHKEKEEAVESFFQELADITMSTKEGISKYLVSALYANFVYNFNPKVSLNGSILKAFDGILYPSTKLEDGSEWNIAIKPKCVDQYATLQYVVRGKVSEDLRSVEFSDIGFYKNKKINWYSPWINYDDIIPTDYFLFDTSRHSVQSKEGALYDKAGKAIPNPFAVFNSKKEQWADSYVQALQQSVKPDVNIDELCEDNLPSIIYKGYSIAIKVDGWKFITNGISYDIAIIAFNVQVTSTFKKTDSPKGVNWIHQQSKKLELPDN